MNEKGDKGKGNVYPSNRSKEHKKMTNFMSSFVVVIALLHVCGYHQGFGEACVQKNNCKANGTFKRKYSAIDKTASQGWRARQSCINDFQTLCVDNSEFMVLSASPVLTSMPEGSQEEHEGGPIKSEQQEELRRLRYERSLEKRRQRRMLKLIGMEECLSTKIDRIAAPECRTYMSARAQCFSEAAQICPIVHTTSKYSSSEEAPPPPIIASQPSSMSMSVVNQTARALERAAMVCLRGEETVVHFTHECLNSTFYKTVLAIRGEAARKMSPKVKEGLKGKHVNIPDFVVR